MAERNYRRDDNIRQTGRYAYIDGSTVRKLQTRPCTGKERNREKTGTAATQKTDECQNKTQPCTCTADASA